MENDGDALPNFWFQPPIATRRRPPSPFLSPVILIIVVPILALLLIFFFLLPFLNHTSQFLNIKPTSVKKSWDSLNIFLVLFAILCGVLSRRNDDVSTPDVDGDGGGGGDQVNRFSSSDQSLWGERFIERDRKAYSGSVRESVVTDSSRLRRNSSSYPDLRQESVWDTGDNQFRYFDDLGVNLNSDPPGYVQQPAWRNDPARENVVHRSPLPMRRRKVERENVLHRSQSAESVHLQDVSRRSVVLERESVLYRSPTSSQQRNEVERGNILNPSQSAVSDHFDYRPRRSEAEREISVEKEIPVDTYQVHRLQSPAPPPPPPPPATSFKPRQSYQSVKRKEKVKFESECEAELEKLWPPLTPPPPPPPPPPPASFTHRSQQKHKKLERQISDATKEIATAITSLYNQSKKKKKRRTRIIYDHANVSPTSANSSPEQAAAPPPAPPPPPLPPPPFVFHNIFKKGTKQKRIHSVAAAPPFLSQSQPPPPPPPPPPPSSIFNNLFKNSGKSKRFNSTAATPRPPPPPSSILNSIFNSGSKSKRHSPTVYPPQPRAPPSPPLSPTTFTESQTTGSFQAYSNSHVLSPHLSRRKIQTPPPPTLSNSEPLRRRPSSKGKPPLPTKATNYYERDEYHEYLNSGSQSPLHPIPPPLPPFTMPAMKFKIRGDFVSIGSAQSSVCNSPDREAVDFSSMQKSLEESDGGDFIGPVFFPSPDVNAKADNFISRLKDEWRMEKVNSNKGKQKLGLGLLGLGPGISPQ